MGGGEGRGGGWTGKSGSMYQSPGEGMNEQKL